MENQPSVSGVSKRSANFSHDEEQILVLILGLNNSYDSDQHLAGKHKNYTLVRLIISLQCVLF